MKYKIQQWLLLIAVLLVSLNVSAIDFYSGSFAYNINPDGKSVSVTYNEQDGKYPAPTYSGNIVIPDHVIHNGQNYPVTSVGNHAFNNCTGLTSVIIPNTVTSIGRCAFFDCKGLTFVTIGSSIALIEEVAFSGCYSLSCVNILQPQPPVLERDVFYGNPNFMVPEGSLQAYQNSAWKGFNLKEGFAIVDGDLLFGLDFIAKTARVLGGKNKYIMSIDIPSTVTYNGETFTVTSIADKAFFTYTSLASVTLPNSITSIGWSAFAICDKLASINIPNSVTAIVSSAFDGCIRLTSLAIPNSVTSIGDFAFSRCKSLNSMTISKNVTTLGTRVFEGCESLASLVVESGNPKYDSRDNCNAIIETATNKLLYGSNSTVIPNTITSIENGAFYNRKGLKSITIPESITTIGLGVFAGCSGLTSIEIPNWVTSIGEFAFSECSGLSSLTIPKSVTTIGASAFFNCSGLTSLTIPSTVTSVGGGAFSNTSLNYIAIDDLKWYLTTGSQLCLQFPGSICLNGVKIKHVIIPDGIEDVRESAFYYCTDVTGVTISNTVKNIRQNAFFGCSSLQNVMIGNSLQNIDKGVFKGCYNIKEITCLCPVPPTINALTFDNYNAIVYVPEGSLNSYMYAEHWKNFPRIVAGVSGVEGIEADGIKVASKGGAIKVSGAEGERVEVYSLSGQCVYSGMDTSIPLGKGIYIVRIAGETHKVII